MAHESSNPKVRLMFVMAIVSAISLMIFDQIFRSYYNSMMEEEEAEKVLHVAPKQLLALRASEQQRLTSAPVSIDKAMSALATKGREDPSLKDLGSKADIQPEASNDTGALVGWGLLAPKTPAGAPPALPAVPGASTQDDHTTSGDGGAIATDGGGAVLVNDAGFATDAKAPGPTPNLLPRGPLPEAGATAPHAPGH